MTNQDLESLLKAAEEAVQSHPQLSHRADNPLHEYLRIAVLRLINDRTHTGKSGVPSVTINYGNDSAMFEQLDDDVDWWETVEPQAHCTRFRISYRRNNWEQLPRPVLEVMTAIGAWRVWEDTTPDRGSSETPQWDEVHFLWPRHHPVEDLLADRLPEDGKETAADGGQIIEGSSSQDSMVPSQPSTAELEPRTRRAREEDMNVSLLRKGGVYEVHSESGNIYEVDVVGKSCTCPDWEKRAPTGGCKHMRRVDQEIQQGRVPRPDGRLPTE